MRRLAILAVTFFLSAMSVAGPNPNPPDASSTEMPKMERFNPDQVDKTLDPCNDFFEYTCKKVEPGQSNSARPGRLGHVQLTGHLERGRGPQHAGSSPPRRPLRLP